MTADTANNARRPAVCLLGVNPHTPNFGVRVLLSGAVECLLNHSRKLEIRVLDYAREPAAWSEATSSGVTTVRLVNLRFSWRVYLPNNIFLLLAFVALARLIPFSGLRQSLLAMNPWLKTVIESEACLSLAGGDSFSDIYGLRRLLYVALPQILVLWLRKPLILLPQTYGPFHGRVARWIAGHIFRKARRVCSRDAAGANTVRRLTGPLHVPVDVIPDVGFVMAPEPVDEGTIAHIEALKKNGPVVGLNISKLLYMGGYTKSNMFSLREDYPRLIHALITFVIHELHASVLLIPHVGGRLSDEENETTLCRQFQAEFEKTHPGKIAFLDEEFSHRQIKTVIGACDLFIGGRMHACIGALSQGVPAVGLAYSPKFAGVFQSVESGDLVLDLRALSSAEITNLVARIFKARSAYALRLSAVLPKVRAGCLTMLGTSPLASDR